MSQDTSILLVDDEPHGRHALSHALGSAGYEVREARSGEEALSLLAVRVPDLILLDIRMPGMDGFEVFRRIKANEKWSGIPIIMISGIVGAKERAEGIGMGASDFITKPFDPAELRARVRMQLEMALLRAAQCRHAEELQVANKALRESERDYRLLFEGMLEGFAQHEILCDESGAPVDYRFLSINPAFEKITGLRAADAIGKTVRELLPQTEASWIERYGHVALTGESTHFEEYSASLGKFFHVTAYRPQPGQFAVVFHDITERKVGEAKVARLNQLYAALSQCNQAIVHSSSTEELFPKICRVAVEFGGMKMAWVGMLDKATGEIRPAAAFGSGTDYLKEIRVTTDTREAVGRGPMGTAVRENTPVWCQDFQNDPRTAAWEKTGAVFGWAAAAALPLWRDGKPIGGFVVYSDRMNAFDEEARELLEEMAEDISFALDAFRREEERKQAEVALHAANHRLEEALEIARNLTLKAEAAALAKSEFLAIISHELRTPLNGVLGFAELLSSTPLGEEQKSFVQTIASSGNHLLSIVNDILDFSSIEKGALAIRSEPFATGGLLDSAEIAISKDAEAKGLEFRCEKEPGVPDQLVGDERRIRQIILNLLNNAVKFTAAGSLVLRVSPASAGDLHFLDFSDEDTGIGIPSDSINRLFQPFVQADSTMQRKFGGTGLGLAISKRIAEAMGGSLTVVSSPGKGSTFKFRLPLTFSSEGTASVPSLFIGGYGASPSGPGAEPCNPFEGDPVLVVDDDRDSRTLAARMLQNLGRRAEFADDGAEALRSFVPGKFSAILMDVSMPVMDGLEATRKIREVEATSEGHVPIIALTAYAMPGDRERCLAAGMDEFLSKPFHKAELAALLELASKIP